MSTGKRLADENGNDLPELDPHGDMAKLVFLLEYARKRGFRVGPTVQIGELIVQVRDLRQQEGKASPVDDGDIWAEHGHKEP